MTQYKIDPDEQTSDTLLDVVTYCISFSETPVFFFLGMLCD